MHDPSPTLATIPLDNPPSISARELHEILVRSHAALNTVKKRFIDALRALHDSKLCRQLGFPNIVAYSRATFRYGRSRTLEFIHVSRALVSLRGIAAAFEQGAISFELAARLSEVATAETEGGRTEGRKETGLSPFTIVVHQCPDCARGALDTSDGPVELEPGALERIAGEAQVVVPEETAPSPENPVPPGERDKPNSPALRKAVCQRHGGRCANPHCHRLVEEQGQSHHLQARALGGRTELGNSVWLCGLCHALHHAGALLIEGDPLRGLVFRPAAMSLTSAIRKELESVRELPVVRTVEVPQAMSGPLDSEVGMSTAQAALEKLGFPRKEARRRLESIAGRGSGSSCATGELVKEALRL